MDAKMNDIMAYRNRIRLAGRIINSTIGILDGIRAEGQAMTEHPLLNAARGNLEEAIDALNGVHEPKEGKPGYVTVSPEARQRLIEEHGLREDDFYVE